MTKEEAIMFLKCDRERTCYDFKIGHCDGCNTRTALDMAIKALKAEPVKHGYWLFYEEPDGYYHSECSECGQWCDEDVFLKGKWHYCPNCGTKMDKDEWQEPEINPCRGCDDYDGQGWCKSNGGCALKPTTTVKHGRWIKVEDDYNNHLYECSCCHTWTSLPTEEVNDGNIRYCWSCGAKMDGVTK